MKWIRSRVTRLQTTNLMLYPCQMRHKSKSLNNFLIHIVHFVQISLDSLKIPPNVPVVSIENCVTIIYLIMPILMLSKTDFVEKQIVTIGCEQLRTLTLKNSNLLVKQSDQTVSQLPCSKIFCVFVIGDCTISTKLVKELLRYQICVYCLSQSLKPLFVIGGSLEGNYILRQGQYARSVADDLHLAKQLVSNKVSNQLALLKSLRNKPDDLSQKIVQIS